MANPYNNLSDEKLMQLYVNGQYKAFEQIYKRHKSRVYNYLRKRLKNEESIKDIFQNIFVKFHRFRDKYDCKYSLVKWIYTISSSELIDYCRKNKIIEVEFDEKYITSSNDETETSFLDISNEKLLTSNEKEALKLRYYCEKEFDEISQILNTSKSNTRKIISRAIGKLKLKYRGV